MRQNATTGAPVRSEPKLGTPAPRGLRRRRRRTARRPSRPLPAPSVDPYLEHHRPFDAMHRCSPCAQPRASVCAPIGVQLSRRPAPPDLRQPFPRATVRVAADAAALPSAIIVVGVVARGGCHPMAITRWAPFQELDSMERRLRRVFEDAGLAPKLTPAADICETDDRFVVELEVPGFEKEARDRGQRPHAEGQRLAPRGSGEGGEVLQAPRAPRPAVRAHVPAAVRGRRGARPRPSPRASSGWRRARPPAPRHTRCRSRLTRRGGRPRIARAAVAAAPVRLVDQLARHREDREPPHQDAEADESGGVEHRPNLPAEGGVADEGSTQW